MHGGMKVRVAVITPLVVGALVHEYSRECTNWYFKLPIPETLDLFLK